MRALQLDPEPALAGLCGLGLLSCGMFTLGLMHGYRTGILFALMAALTARSGRCVVASATRSSPLISIITARGLCVRAVHRLRC